MFEKAARVSLFLFVFVSLLLMLWGLGAALKRKQFGHYPAPKFSLTLLDGREVTLKTFSGSPLMINFWASWCKACVEEAPVLVEAYNRYKDEGLVLLGVAVQDTEKNVKAFQKRFGISFPLGMDSEGILSGQFGITGVPESFFIDRKGQIVRHVPEPLDEMTIKVYLEEIL